MKKKSIMIDMDEVIVVGNFSNYLIEFLGNVDWDKLHSQPLCTKSTEWLTREYFLRIRH